MTKNDVPIPIYKLAFLQAYLYEIFSTEKKCEKNFKYTVWYLHENFSENEIDRIINFFNEQGINCDCGIIKKLDLKEYSDGRINFHETDKKET
jgi:hypothetical protein